VGCGIALRRQSLSSGQERELLQIIKSLVYLLPDFQISPGSVVFNEIPKSSLPDISSVKLSPLKWQEQAFEAWTNSGRKGIIKAVTGSGKTYIALTAILECLRENGTVFVIVPTRALLLQWQDEISKKLFISKDQIGLAGGGNRCNPHRQKITIWVINSARKNLPRMLNEQKFSDPTLLIVDECHRAGSRENSRLFSAKFDSAMGLSATPERQQDTGYERLLVPNIGEQIYNYSFSEAIQDSIIPPFDIVNLGVDLTNWEREEYNRQSEEISRQLSALMYAYKHIKWHICRNYFPNKCFRHFERLSGLCPRCHSFNKYEDVSESPQFFKFLNYISEYENDKRANMVFQLLFQRKRLVVDAKERIPLALEILGKIPKEFKTIVFQERIASAEEVFDSLKQMKGENSIGIYHSMLSDNYRRIILDKFREDKINTLISCKALDEGLDVPSVNIGVIVSSSSSIRQKIQRLGRILRIHPNKKKSVVFNIYVRNTTERNLMFRDFENDQMDKMVGFFAPDKNEEKWFIECYMLKLAFENSR
jgi:superfamily II DNA or RNA helicase